MALTAKGAQARFPNGSLPTLSPASLLLARFRAAAPEAQRRLPTCTSKRTSGIISHEQSAPFMQQPTSEGAVKLVAYADESHSGRNSEILIIAGWIALHVEWTQFSVAWQKVLDRHTAPYFHFREWADASAVLRGKRRASSEFLKKNPYQGWGQPKLDSFLTELAEVAASSPALMIGGYVPAKKLVEDKASGLAKTPCSAEQLCIKHFFNSAVSTINEDRPPLKRQPIEFVFDHSDDPGWKSIIKAAFDFSRATNTHFKEMSFASKKDHLPLQVADMAAYRLRQTMEGLVTFDLSKTWEKLDTILFRKMNASSTGLTDRERDAMLRRVFVVPEDATYDQAMDAITSHPDYKPRKRPAP